MSLPHRRGERKRGKGRECMFWKRGERERERERVREVTGYSEREKKSTLDE